jgi:alpha-glucosidase
MPSLPIKVVATALLAVLLWTAPAQAEVRVGSRQVEVVTASGRAIVRLRPFRISFENRGGRTVLAEVGRRPRRGVGIQPAYDPQPLGQDRPAPAAVYAPLGFIVGQERRAQWTGSFWPGDLLFARRGGTSYSARRVIGVEFVRGGVRLTVATNDPHRRKLIVSVLGDAGGALRVKARVNPRRGVIALADSFGRPPGESFRGFGGQHWGLDQQGKALQGWIAQENFGGPAALAATPLLPTFVAAGTGFTLDELGGFDPNYAAGGAEHYMFPSGPSGAYYFQSQFASSRGYGFLLNQTQFSRWRMGSQQRSRWQVDVDAARLDYTVAPARPQRAAAKLSAITGRHLLPPKWAQGPTLSRTIQTNGSETALTYRQKVNDDLAEIESRHPPITAYAFEGWALLDDPAFVRQTIRRLHRMGVKAVLYVRSFVANDSLKTQPPGDYDEVIRKHLVATTARGRPARFDANGSPAVVLDFTKRATSRWWRRRLDYILRLGADGFMQDFGEQTLDGMHFSDGSKGPAMHNRYPVLYHRTSRRILDSYSERRHRPKIWFFTRAGYSGRPGSAAYEMGNFPGDETADWSAASGLASLAPDMLNRAIGGAFGYDTDIGGYIDLLTGPTDSELFTRWTEWAALTPYLRVHNDAQNGVRMPWDYDQTTYRRWVDLARLHSRALPLIRRAWRKGRRNGVPPTRPLWLAFPRDRGAAEQTQEWMLGANVLVAPVVEQGATGRRVRFPAGCWSRPGGSGRVRGPATKQVSAPPGELPYYFRCGSNPF